MNLEKPDNDSLQEEVCGLCRRPLRSRTFEDGLTYGAPTEKEYILAEMVQEQMPSMEMIRLVNSGTEAVMSAVRVARGFTGREKIVKFRGCYHGHSDGLLVKAGSGALTQSIPDSLGVLADAAKHTLVAEHNDEASVKALFEENPDSLRGIADQYHALLIFDEVITGFRLSLGGAQESKRCVF